MRKKTLITCTILIVIAVIVLVGYNVYRRPAAFRHFTDKTLDEQQINELKNTILAKDDKKILVAYFSYSGTTKNVATTLSEKTGADLFEIAPKKEYSNVYAQSNREIRRGSRPELAENISNIDDYDIVFVGYPVWWHATPAPVNTFLESYNFNGKLIIPFCTSGESDIDETMPTFLDSCEGLAVYGEKRISGTREIDNWLQELGMANENSTAVEREVNYEYKTEELYANREGNQIYGVIYIPQSAGEQMPTVIFSHGFGGNYQVGTQYAKGLAAKGYVVYCFDFCGGSTGSQSDGSTLEMSIFTEQKDLEAVISMIQSLDCVDADNIFLMGTSQGGAVSAITAAEHKDEIKGAVLLYPAFCLVDMTKERFKSVEEIPDTYYSLWMTVGRAYAENLMDYDIYDAVSAYKKDVLILHGDSDNIVPLSYSEKALEVYSSARLEVFPGAGHGFYGEDAERAVELMTEYLDSHRA